VLYFLKASAKVKSFLI